MKTNRRMLAVLLLASAARLAAVDSPKPAPGPASAPVPEPVSCGDLPEVAPGQALQLKCAKLSGDATVTFTSDDGKTFKSPGRATPDSPSPDAQSPDSKSPDSTSLGVLLKFTVPSVAAPAPYSLTFADTPIQGRLVVMPAVVVDAIYPGTSYPRQGFSFKIVGKNFSTDPKGNVIELVDEALLSNCAHQVVPPPASDTPCLIASPSDSSKTSIPSTSEIDVTGFYPKHYYGAVKVRVKVGDNVSQAKPVIFAQYSQPAVVLAAAAVFFAIVFVLYKFVAKGIQGDRVNGITPTTWTSLFLDRETNSYSLSKFQVIAWTAVTVYSYVYLFLCRTLIQGDFTFPDVSQNLPQLFFISAGTTVAAVAITANIGSKGSGAIQPSAADFISTGGLVVGDRFQFFTWTIVGTIGYLYLVMRMNPETANISLPDIPQNFLYLIGVSSAGYLGGKVVRKPGPVIKADQLSVAKVTPNPGNLAPQAQRAALAEIYRPKDDAVVVTLPVLSLNLKGESLDPTGTIKVDDQPIRSGMFWINGVPDPPSQFCTEMKVSFNDAAQYIEGTHTLTLINQDGQSATVGFPNDPMIINPVDALTANAAAADVKITGKNFVAGSTFEWRNPSTSPAPTAQGDATFRSATEFSLNFAPGAAGTGKLTLISPMLLRASVSVTVR